MSGEDNVVSFDAARSRADRPPSLSDAELVRLRAMLEAFDKVCYGCPTARMVLDR